MGKLARKIKIRIRKGKFFRLSLPALSFKFFKRICRFAIKYSKHENANIANNEVDLAELMDSLDMIAEELSKLEPFVLVEASHEAEGVFVKIETV